MPVERFTVTALPLSCGADAEFHVSLFVSPQLTPGGSRSTLGSYPHFLHWADALLDPTTVVEVADQRGVVETTPILDLLDVDAWDAAFPKTTPVRAQGVPQWQQRRWRSFRLAQVHDAAKAVHVLTTTLSPTSLPPPGTHFLRSLHGRLNMSPQQATGRLDGLIGEDLPLTDNRSLEEVERRVADEKDTFLRLALDLHRLRRYYERPESQRTFHERPLDPPVKAKPVPRPTPDFHERCALAGDHAPLLRRLGLVIDLRVLDPERLRGSAWLEGRILPRGDQELGSSTRTRCEAVGNDLVTVAGSPDWDRGRLRLGDPGRFSLLDLDADGSGLKLERFLWSLPGLLRAEANGDPVNAATPALRAPGFTVARTGRAQTTQSRLDRQKDLRAALEIGRPPLLDTEDVTRGYRVEVWDDTAGAWATLHARRIDVDVDGKRILADAAEEGWIQTTAAHETADVENSPIHIHEAAFGWEGWSLSAPKPGRRVRHEPGAVAPDGTELDTGEVVEDPDPGVVDKPVTPVVVRTRVQPGSLPKLRYGRSYAFRAWAVDLAGNSRPHVVGSPPVPVPVPVAGRPVVVAGVRPVDGAPAAHELVELARAQLIAAFDADADAASTAPTGREGVEAAIEDRLARLGPGVLSRLRERRGGSVPRPSGAAVSRPELVRRAAERIVRSPEQPLVLDTAVRDPGRLGRLVAGDPDIGIGTPSAATVTPLRPYLRWDPVLPPAIVARARYTAGESLRRVVLRSGVTQDLATLALTVTPPAAYAAVDPARGYRGTAQRHLVPPKTSQPQAELHGAFDDAIGSTDPSEHLRLLAVALRESGTLFDVDVPRLDDPTVRDPQPGISLEHEASLTPAELAALPLPLGTTPAPGQYVVHDTDELAVPYLPDWVARGVSLSFPEAGLDRNLNHPFGTEGFTVRYRGEWPELEPYRLVVSDAAGELTGRVKGNQIHILLPPGDLLRIKVASTLDRQDLDLFGTWRASPLEKDDDAMEAAADGLLWGLTPSEDVVLVHAVPRPVEIPVPTVMRPERSEGSVEAVLVGGVDVHGNSTESLSAEAGWSETTDDLSLPRPELRANRAVAFTTPVAPFEDLAALDDNDFTGDVPGFGPVASHRAVHRFPDTKHRLVSYRFRATTRFREYFEPAELAAAPPLPGASVFDPVDDGRSVVGPAVELSIPSSAPPAAPLVHSVIPLFRWDQVGEPEQPLALRRRRRAGVRIYLERPWFSSGDGELLGVLLSAGSLDKESEWVSRWGADPIWASAPVEERAMSHQFQDELHVRGLDERVRDAGPVGPPRFLPLPEDGTAEVMVLGYRPQFNEQRGLWYVDVAIDPGETFWPFVRLVVVRYQPDSVPGCHLSRPVRCDFVQLTPERTTSVSRTDDRHVRVVVSGPVGTARLPHDTRISPPEPVEIADHRTMRARLQRQDPALPTDLGWETVDVVTLVVRGGSAFHPAWIGSLTSPGPLPLTRPGEDHGWRVLVEEFERLPGDPPDLGERGAAVWETRLIYADEVAL